MSRIHLRVPVIKRIVKSITITTVLLGVFSCSSSPPKPQALPPHGDYATLQNEIPQLVEKAMKDKKITGLSIAVVNDQDVVYSQGFGYAKKSSNKKVSPDTVFCVASVSKIFTGMAIMQLAEQGKIDLDSPIKTYLPDFNIKSRFENSPQITVRHLLTHHSGLPSDRVKGYFFEEFYGTNAAVIPQSDSFYSLASLMRDDYVATKPDTIFSYSNIGYALLGDIVSRVSGMPFDNYVKKYLLAPTSMLNSTFNISEVNQELLSLGYLNGEEVGVPVIRDIPAGQLMSSANDLAQTMIMIFSDGYYDKKSILKKSSIEEMFRIQNADIKNDGYFRIGLTFWALPIGNPLENARWHGGDLPPYYAAFVTLPETKLGVVILTNSAAEGSLDLMDIAQPALELAYEIKTSQRLAKPTQINPINMSHQALSKYEGRYAMTLGAIDVKAKNNELELNLMGKTLRAVPQSNDTFSPYYNFLGFIPLHPDELKNIQIAFQDSDEGPRLKLQRSGISAMGTLASIIPFPIHQSWLSRVGQYDVLNPDDEEGYTPTAFEYSETDGYLYFVLNMAGERYNGAQIRFPLKTLSDTQAVIMGEGRAMGESVLVLNEAGQEYIYYSGYKLKKKDRR